MKLLGKNINILNKNNVDERTFCKDIMSYDEHFVIKSPGSDEETLLANGDSEPKQTDLLLFRSERLPS